MHFVVHHFRLVTPRPTSPFTTHHFLRLRHNPAYSTDSPLPATTNLSRLLQGRIPRAHLLQLHARIFRLNAHQNDLIATRLIGHYPPNPALRLFRQLQSPNIFPFNAIIRVLAEERRLVLNAFIVFKELKCRPISPNELTFSFLLKACCRDGVGVDFVKPLQAHVLKSGFMCDSFVCNGLLMVYARAVKDLRCARQVFDEMPERNMVSCWTVLISGYAKLGLAEKALNLFVTMLEEENLQPENDTMVSVLSACSSLATPGVQKWVNLLEQCQPNNLSSRDYVSILLVYLYGKLRNVERSREVFDREISANGKRSVLSWNAMIGAYVQNGCALEAINVFKSMADNHDECPPNHVTMVSVLSACAEIGDLELGTWVHEYMRTKGKKAMLSSNVNLATALIDMYSKCGSLDSARKVFDQITSKDVVSFNAMITGLAVNGKAKEALTLYSEMQELCLRPDSNTLLGALCACNHSGLLDKGREIFYKSGITPRLEHYACFVDLLARSGFIEEALGVVNSMAFEPNNFVWGALLSGCVLHDRLDLAQSISAMLVRADPKSSAGYVLLSNTFAGDGRWREVSGVRKAMREKGVTKQTGRSWVKVGGVVHEFGAGCDSHHLIGRIRWSGARVWCRVRLASSDRENSRDDEGSVDGNAIS